jgi:hypothetical protein
VYPDLPHSVTAIQNLPVLGIISDLNWTKSLIAGVGQRLQSFPPGLLDGTYSGVMIMNAAKKQINDLYDMPENWDGYGGKRICYETRQNAIRAVDILLRNLPIPDIVPNPNGTISFEWESAQGIGHLEIGKTRFSFYVKPRSGKPILANGFADRISGDIGSLVENILSPVPHMTNTMTKIDILHNVRFAY